LHHLVAHGDLDLVENAIRLGADPSIKDENFGADASGWADFFNHSDIAARLAR
ncbi:MAG: hypothetical protein V7636_569, partial [Actinomycetota bacterium]